MIDRHEFAFKTVGLVNKDKPWCCVFNKFHLSKPLMNPTSEIIVNMIIIQYLLYYARAEDEFRTRKNNNIYIYMGIAACDQFR